MSVVISIVVAIVVGGIIWYIAQILLNMAPIPAPLKQIANALIVLAVILWVVSLLGFWEPASLFGYHHAVIVR